MSDTTTLSHEDALMWLNDRLGNKTSVGVVIGTRGEPVPTLLAKGTLAHLGSRMLGGDDDRSGFYRVGPGGYLDLTALEDAELEQHEDSATLYFRPAENVLVSVLVDDEAGDA